jgi:hypothetical protein
VLEEAGYVTIEAADVSSGLKILRSNARIDLLVTDVGLPGGMNGRQVAGAARTFGPVLKVMFLTGYPAKCRFGPDIAPRFLNWNRLVTVLYGWRSNTAPAASKCYNRPNDADSLRNHKNIFAVIFPLKSKA